MDSIYFICTTGHRLQWHRPHRELEASQVPLHRGAVHGGSRQVGAGGRRRHHPEEEQPAFPPHC